MSIHYDDHDARFTSVSYRTPGTVLGELELQPGQYAITIGDDPTAIVYGSVTDLVNFATFIELTITRILAHKVGDGEPEDAGDALD